MDLTVGHGEDEALGQATRLEAFGHVAHAGHHLAADGLHALHHPAVELADPGRSGCHVRGHLLAPCRRRHRLSQRGRGHPNRLHIPLQLFARQFVHFSSSLTCAGKSSAGFAASEVNEKSNKLLGKHRPESELGPIGFARSFASLTLRRRNAGVDVTMAFRLRSTVPSLSTVATRGEAPPPGRTSTRAQRVHRRYSSASRCSSLRQPGRWASSDVTLRRRHHEADLRQAQCIDRQADGVDREALVGRGDRRLLIQRQ